MSPSATRSMVISMTLAVVVFLLIGHFAVWWLAFAIYGCCLFVFACIVILNDIWSIIRRDNGYLPDVNDVDPEKTRI